MSRAASESRIRILPPQVANQIAAGEVVERPASVVKELLENSLDAGARSIEVEIEKGGGQRIRIRDDGHGIHRDDLVLALTPHATSKIETADDLEGVNSLGFRGEALASIASVSRLLLSSCRAGEKSGWQVASEARTAIPTPLAQGTEIEVHELFYNTPARRKFLRAERTEFSHVEEVIRRVALSRFDLALRFSHNGKQILRLKPSPTGSGGMRRRVAEVLGSTFADNSLEIDVTAGGLRLWGWVGRASYSRSQADVHYFYLNGRMIRDRLVSHAVRLAFGERIPEGRYPAYLLYLELDPRLVDVNVHPTKHEVRFREARQVHDFIYWAINGTLVGGGSISNDAAVAAAVRYEPTPQAAESYRAPLRTAVSERASGYAAQPSVSMGTAREGDALGRVACQLHNGYLLAERGETTILIDLRAMLIALHQRRLTMPGGEALLTAQPLLIPESLPTDVEAAALWRERGALLEPYGFEFGWLGDTLLVLRKVPAIVRAASIAPLLKELQGWLGETGDNAESARDKLMGLLSHHSVPQQLAAYSLSELNSLLREYETTLTHSMPRPWRELNPGDWQRLFEIFP